MQVTDTKGTWRIREQCVPGSLFSCPAREPGDEASPRPPKVERAYARSYSRYLGPPSNSVLEPPLLRGLSLTVTNFLHVCKV